MYQKRNRFRVIWGQYLGRDECPYMQRWALETPWGSLRVHRWISSDDHRYFHDHAWWFLTLVISGEYTDVNPKGRDRMKAGSIRFRPANHQHTVEVKPPGCWTILLTGPHIRFWGFHINGKFVKSNKYFLENGHHPCV